MGIDEYQRAAHETARSDDVEVFTLGLFGEAGSVATTIKKLKRDNEAAEVVKQEIATELGDVLWYLAELASAHDLKLSDIAQRNLDKAAFTREIEAVLDAIASLTDEQLKTRVYLTRPMRDALAAEKQGISQLNKPLLT